MVTAQLDSARRKRRIRRPVLIIAVDGQVLDRRPARVSILAGEGPARLVVVHVLAAHVELDRRVAHAGAADIPAAFYEPLIGSRRAYGALSMAHRGIISGQQMDGRILRQRGEERVEIL